MFEDLGGRVGDGVVVDDLLLHLLKTSEVKGEDPEQVVESSSMDGGRFRRISAENEGL